MEAYRRQKQSNMETNISEKMEVGGSKMAEAAACAAAENKTVCDSCTFQAEEGIKECVVEGISHSDTAVQAVATEGWGGTGADKPPGGPATGLTLERTLTAERPILSWGRPGQRNRWQGPKRLHNLV